MQVDSCPCGRQGHETEFCVNTNCKARIVCQNCLCKRRATWLCQELSEIKNRFLCSECYNKKQDRLIDFFGLNDFQSFKDNFLTKHIEQVRRHGKILKRIVESQIRELILQLSSLLEQFNQTLHLNKDVNGAIEEICQNKIQLNRYIRSSFNYLRYQDVIKSNFQKYTEDCKSQISNLHNFCRQTEILINCKQENIKDFHQECAKLFKAKQYTQALKVSHKYLTISPDDVPMLKNAGVCLHELGKYSEAHKYFEKIEKINFFGNIKQNEFYTYYGHTLHKIAKYREALNKFKAVLSRSENHLAYLYLGNTLIKLKYYDEAISVFSKLELQSNNISAKNLLDDNRTQFDEQQQILYYRYKAKLVLKTYKTDAELKPIQGKLEESYYNHQNNTKIMFSLGNFYMQTVQLQKAKEIFNEIENIEPDHKKLGDCMLKLQQQIKQYDRKKGTFTIFDCLMKCCRRDEYWLQNTIQQ